MKDLGQDPISLDLSAIFVPPTIPLGSSLSALPPSARTCTLTPHHGWAIGPDTNGPALTRTRPRSGPGPPHDPPAPSQQARWGHTRLLAAPAQALTRCSPAHLGTGPARARPDPGQPFPARAPASVGSNSHGRCVPCSLTLSQTR